MNKFELQIPTFEPFISQILTQSNFSCTSIRLSELGTNFWFVYINLPAKKDIKRIFWKKKIKVMAVFRQFRLIFTFKRNHCFSRHKSKARNSKGKCKPVTFLTDMAATLISVFGIKNADHWCTWHSISWPHYLATSLQSLRWWAQLCRPGLQ